MRRRREDRWFIWLFLFSGYSARLYCELQGSAARIWNCSGFSNAILLRPIDQILQWCDKCTVEKNPLQTWTLNALKVLGFLGLNKIQLKRYSTHRSRKYTPLFPIHSLKSPPISERNNPRKRIPPERGFLILTIWQVWTNIILH